MRAKLALAAIRRLHALTTEIKGMETDIAEALQRRPHKHLMAIPGVGPLVAAKIYRAMLHDLAQQAEPTPTSAKSTAA